MVHADAEIRDQFDGIGQARDQVGIDPVGYRGDQHVRALGRRHYFISRHRRITGIQTRVEQLHHARLHVSWQRPGNDDDRFPIGHIQPVSLNLLTLGID